MQTGDAIISEAKTVQKKNGQFQSLSEDKIRRRLESLLDGLAVAHINIDLIINKVLAYTQNGN